MMVSQSKEHSMAQVTKTRLSRRRLLHLFGTGAVTLSLSGLLQACADDELDDDPDDAVGATADGLDDDSGDDHEPIEDPDDAVDDVADDDPEFGGALRYALSADPDNWTPHTVVGCSNMTIMSQVWSALVRYDEDSELVGDLAESWEWEDDTTLVFHLRDDVVWHNGDSLSADHVVQSMEHLLDPAVSLRAEPLNAVIDSWEVTDEFTVTLNLSQVDVVILRMLTTAPGQAFVLHPDFDEATSGQSAETTVGTGPFMYESYEPGVSVRLVRNPDYFLDEFPRLDAIDFRIIEDEEARVTALRTDEVDITEYIDFPTVATLRDDPDIYIPEEGDGFYGKRLLLDSSRPPTDDQAVREALNFAIDREMVVNTVLAGEGTPIWGGPIPSGRFGYAPELDGYYSHDPDRAISLLEEAGWTETLEDGRLAKDGEPLTLSYATSSTSWWAQVGEVFQQNLREIGVTLELDLSPWAEFSEKRQAQADLPEGEMGDFNILGTTIWGLDLADEMQFHVTGGWTNFTRYSNPEMDDLFRQARETIDDDEREELFREAQALAIEEATQITPCWIVRAEAVRSRVKFTHLREEGCLGILVWQAHLEQE